MRLLPQSLFGRLVLILLAGLLLAQSLSALIQFRDRGDTLYQASGLQSAQRIADIVRLLESSGPREREQLVAALNAPPLRISLTDPPWSETDSKMTSEGLAAVFRALLDRSLGGGYSLTVAVTETTSMAPVQGSMGPGHMGMGAPMGGRHMARLGVLPPGGLSFLAQVRLRDGTWVTFEHRIPKEVFAWSTRLLLTLAVLLAAVVLLSLLAVRWITRPLSILAGAADELGRDIHRPPLPETGPVEARHAARAFNTMQARLARYIKDRTRILTAVSHDLKTPITRLRLRAELLDDPKLRASFVKDLDEMQAMTAATLDFLRGMESEEAIQPVDVRALLESLKADADEMGRKVEINGDNPAPYPARPLALKRCIANLIDNALKYGGQAHITLTEQGKQLRIVVADEGPGIPEQELDKVFEPFYRVETSRSRDTGGTGLGLSIARNIARAHGGELVLRNRRGGGLEAVLTLSR